MNRIFLVGNVGRTPEVKIFDSGSRVMRFSLAVKPNWVPKKDAAANEPEKTNWINVVVWAKLAEILEGKVLKGSRVVVEGELETRQYQGKDGTTKTAFEVRAESVNLIQSLRPATPPTPDYPAEDQSGPAF